MSRFLNICCFLLLLGVSVSVYAGDPDTTVVTTHPAEKLYYPEYSYEFVPESNYEIIEERLSTLESEIPMNFNTTVLGFIDYFAVRDREYTKMIIRKKELYFPLFEKYLKKYDLPDELKYLSIIESGLNPQAISRARAVGLWQFMSATGRMYKLHQDWYVDERMSPEKATEAACKYLKQLHGMFGDWELALAAYNAGPGNVRKAIRRSGYIRDFWSLYRYLPRETRSYVPQFVAMVYVLNFKEEHNFFEENILYPMAYDTVHVSNYVHLKTFAELMNVCESDLQLLNPEIRRGALPANIRNYPLKVPSDKLAFVQENKTFLLDSASKTGKQEIAYKARNSVGSTYGRERVVYRVQNGDVIGLIAERYHVRVSDIRSWNNLRSNMIRIGQPLVIWVRPGSKPAPSYAKASKPAPKPIPLDAKTYVVQPGDTLWDISRKFEGLSIEKIKKLNNLKDHKIKPGQKLILG